MRTHVFAALALLALAVVGCTDYKFAGDLRCGVNGLCPPGHFCDTADEVCLRDLEGCGDGTLDPEEICDDGNRTSGDGCRADCLKIEVCGDGVKDPQEQCDAGEANADTAACLPTCVAATCGDGHVQVGVEACDDSNNIETDSCLKTCQAPTCGDGFVHFGSELCDDGNAINGDGCNTDCRTPEVVQVVAGQNHTCVLRASGKVRCWGRGTFGQLGYGNLNDIGDNEIPASVGDVSVGGTVVQIAAGADHTCVLLTTGAVRCWGAGSRGQLGYGNPNNIGDNEIPASAGDVLVGGTVVQITAGGEHTCALLATGTVRCWGSGFAGQLGYGNITDIGDNEIPATVGDVPVGGSVMQIAAGVVHTCALLNTGSVRCWGEGQFGRLGYGNETDIGDNEAPASAGDVLVGGSVVQISASNENTCALLDTGAVRCWGDGFLGQLGYGNQTDVGDNEAPSSAGDVLIGGTVARVTAGGFHTCALLTAGTIRCWGKGSEGQLGYGNPTDIGDNETPSSAGDVPIGEAVVQITAGASHTCALLTTGAVRCWGANSHGKLGYGNNIPIGDNESPASAGDITVGAAATQISTGGKHACALFDTGMVRCWGASGFGQLGYGDDQSIGDNELPSSAGYVPIHGIVVQLATGSRHTCALLDTGKVRCWGAGEYGQLGYGNKDPVGDDETPASAGDVPITGAVIQIVAGGDHTCALLNTGNVRCWGMGSRGQLGYSNKDSIGDDETIAGVGDVLVGGTVVQITAGSAHTCALLDTHHVRCWGMGIRGQLGYGNPDDIGDNEVPGSAGNVPLGDTVSQITAGGLHTCALLETGEVRCWGAGNSGQLGYGNMGDIGDNEGPASAGDVLVGGAVDQIAAGSAHTCALLKTGNLRCWGYGFFGQLGYGNKNNIGDNEPPSSAGDVNVGEAVAQVAAGFSGSVLESHTCARLTDGNIRCWGYGFFGQLGHGNKNDIGDNEPPASAGDVPLF
ncbi:MAG TPA: DUF4215 domain-containing protein [Kofleriaceae bacterium]|nr:DUF4215 domain-containing protein [Kofleriaceae bacterium]